MPGVGHDTKYLQELVGDALARGAAACVVAQPTDPVEYLGQWLLRYVKNAEVEGQFYEQKRAELEAKKKELEDAQAAAQKAKAAEETKAAAIAELAAMEAEPRILMQHAVDLITRFTTAGSAYAALVAEPEEPDWSPPEDPEDPEAAESEDEADPTPAPPAEEGAGEGGEEGDAQAEGEGGEAAAEEGEDGVVKVPRPIDYSKKYFSYMAASAMNEFMANVELRRPPPPPEDADEDFQPEPAAFTFRILDERMPMVYTPNVAFDKTVKFFRNFPKIGAYQACGIQSGPGTEFKAIVAADTLFPEGSGQSLSQEDQDFIWEVSLALGKAYDKVEKKFLEEQQGKSAKEDIAALKKRILEIYHPPEDEEEEEVAPPTPSAPAGKGGKAPPAP
eukprot:CAMPEP_0202892798 /NCGR_PEP_ID=MMETSP1392-20130828/2487_1 /ASSEMBLY_ACC=CAM_ASM_000868 /TAXON_ID=225041 /ORGANISM="Chlamydomonas chlamydogama, Strain SAG 11-48b" /LENGTH=389 /DNA_ID=CAMNT_0049576889 /DNA_START=171 /DNA_END=1336 /DNA_ORIENTATION=+